MGKRSLDKLLLKCIIENAEEKITLVGPNDRQYLLTSLFGLGYDVTAVDYDPKFKNRDLYECKDAVYDGIDFGDTVVVFNAEKHYPIGKIFSGTMIVVGDNEEHNGDCNPVYSPQQLVEQNNFQEVRYYDSIEKWHIAVGVSHAD